ncbi:MAG: hypothetical protein LBD90_01125, partial [Bifidobacteriaceae bacterium]|nr:hypothetical protein [Bifidobacteriaceae bacterium]
MTPPSWRPLEGAAHRIAVEVLIHGPIARSEIADRLDLSPASLSRLTKPLIDLGLVFEVGSRRGAKGRPTRPLDIDPASRHFVGVKITADQAHGVLTDLRANVIDSQIAVIEDRSPAGVVATVADLARALGAQVGEISALGVSAGGLTQDYQV